MTEINKKKHTITFKKLYLPTRRYVLKNPPLHKKIEKEKVFFSYCRWYYSNSTWDCYGF